MSFFSRFRKKPLQPDLEYAAKGFTPIMAMQMQEIDADFFALADAYADAFAEKGCTSHQETSARWGGVTAIGQDKNLYASFLSAYDDTLRESGVIHEDAKEHGKAKFHAASTMMVALVMADAPGEYERFRSYVGEL